MEILEPLPPQGEVNIFRVSEVPAGITTKAVERRGSGWIIGHSESGHHHVLERAVSVVEQTNDVPAGARILYAIVADPTALRQDAANPHGEAAIPPGTYMFRIAREFDPFAEMARQVAD